jgi:hypothetical protein
VTPAAWRFLVALPAGLALGAFSAFGDGLAAQGPLHLLGAMANAAGPWFVVAFLVGALQRRPVHGSLAALIALVLAVGVYYLGIYAGGHAVAELGRALAAWTIVALIVGPVMGVCGASWAGATARSSTAVGVLGSALLAEAVFRLLQHQVWTGIDVARTDPQVALLDALGAILLPGLLLPKTGRLHSYAVTVALGMVGAGAVWGVTEVARMAVAG